MPDKIDARTKAVLEALGQHIRRTRERQKASQAELARRVVMDPTNLAKVERGEKNLTVDTMLRLAEGLDVDLVIKLRRRRENKMD